MTTPLHSPAAGIVLYALAMASYATGDAMLKVALDTYAFEQTVAIRLGLFLVIALVMAEMRGGFMRAIRTSHPFLQFGRSLALVVDSIGFTISLYAVGLSATHAVFAAIPLFVTALAVPFLGEKVGWRRWSAVGVGFIGALIVIQPGAGSLAWASLAALAGALASACYSIMTRKVSHDDSFETNFFYVALLGFLLSLPFGIMKWQTPDSFGWLLFLGMTVTSLIGHVCVIRALTITEATVLQPFQYTLLATATLYGVLLFGERLETVKIIGAVIVVGSGLYVAWREFVLNRRVLRARSGEVDTGSP